MVVLPATGRETLILVGRTKVLSLDTSTIFLTTSCSCSTLVSSTSTVLSISAGVEVGIFVHKKSFTKSHKIPTNFTFPFLYFSIIDIDLIKIT